MKFGDKTQTTKICLQGPEAAKIDLHAHSNFSDGLLSPAKLIAMAKDKDLSVFALTDHDTMAGFDETARHGRAVGIDVLSGIELTAVHHDLGVHILGYGLDPSVTGLQKTLNDIQQAREKRNQRIIDKLNGLGYKISITELPKLENSQLGRPHIACLLTEKKIVRSEDEAFRRFLRKGAAAYVQREVLTTEKAINTIRSAGGLAVLAHPGILGLSEASLSGLINELCLLGLAGIEVYHPVNSIKNTRFLAKFCDKHKLLQTGGSDFHGRARDKAALGEYGGGRHITRGLLKNLSILTAK